MRKTTKAETFFVNNAQPFWPEQVSLSSYLESDAFHGLFRATSRLLWSEHNASESRQSYSV